MWVTFKEVFLRGGSVSWAGTQLESKQRMPVGRVGERSSTADAEGACQKGAGRVTFPKLKTYHLGAARAVVCTIVFNIDSLTFHLSPSLYEITGLGTVVMTFLHSD